MIIKFDVAYKEWDRHEYHTALTQDELIERWGKYQRNHEDRFDQFVYQLEEEGIVTSVDVYSVGDRQQMDDTISHSLENNNPSN